VAVGDLTHRVRDTRPKYDKSRLGLGFSYSFYIGMGRENGLGREIGCMREMADALWYWEGHALLKTGLSVHGHTHRQTHKSENSISATIWRI